MFELRLLAVVCHHLNTFIIRLYRVTALTSSVYLSSSVYRFQVLVRFAHGLWGER